MKKDYNFLAEVLKKAEQKGPVYYLANPGNWGDALIRYGSLKFFKDIDLNYKELDRKRLNWIIPFIKGGTVIFGGGGAWCSAWDHSSYVAKLSKRFDVIVLPSTYEYSYDFPNTIFFRRDTYESAQAMPNSYFCHDMAFYIGDEFNGSGESCGSGYFFRLDKESSQKIRIPASNVDLSAGARHDAPVDDFFGELSKYSEIYTDRLHVAIASALLGKEVHLYVGSYFKIRAIFESSIKGHFPNVILHDNFDLISFS